MTTSIALRSWQARFVRVLECHPGPDFLLVACPAAGKTIAAGAGVAGVMSARECDQLIVVCPSVIVRDQWQRELARLGYRMDTDFGLAGWPEHVHGVCATYAQVAQRVERYAVACEKRRTVLVCDEIHHAGDDLAWGESLRNAFGGATVRLMLSGTPFRSDEGRIPFVTYDADGRCVPDFGYDYAQAVRDGACRPVRFRPHDGAIVWLEGAEQHAAMFSERVDPGARPRRLRAALDPGKPYLRSLFTAAHEDLLKMREQVPDAAGLVVCDSQPHALEVDQLIAEVTGSLPVLAMSDIPRAHKAIAAFAEDSDEWLVSVRMVSEGVDIPRLGVIVWATAASTELMVRQVSGRALRGRAKYARLPATVHMPADPQLIRYAERLDVLGGISSTTGARSATTRELGEEDPSLLGGQRGSRPKCRAVDAQPLNGTVPPTLDVLSSTTRLSAVEESVEISTPKLPPSPQEIRAAVAARESLRGELFTLLSTYAQLRRLINPAYQLATAHRELAAAVGVVDADAPVEIVTESVDWVRRQVSTLATNHPDQIKELARARRRLAIAS
jgi:superfamily II DNA or RNA helicase